MLIREQWLYSGSGVSHYNPYILATIHSDDKDCSLYEETEEEEELSPLLSLMLALLS